MKHLIRFLQVSCLGLWATLWLGNIAIAPAAAHWADLAVADIIVADTEAQITLTVPTTLLAFTDDNDDNILSQLEFDQHYAQLEQQLSRSIVLTNQADAPGSFTVALAAQLKQTHSTFLLQYQWPDPLQQLSIRYSLFSPELGQCLATITQGNQTRNVVFTPENNTVNIAGTLPWQQQFLRFLKLGVEHIFTGYGHIGVSALMILMGSVWFARRTLAGWL